MSLEDSINKLTVAVETLTKTLEESIPISGFALDMSTIGHAGQLKTETTPAPAAELEAPKKSRKKAAAPVAEPASEPAPEPAVEPEVAIAVEGAGPSEPAPVAEPEVAIAVVDEVRIIGPNRHQIMDKLKPVAEPVKITLQDIRELAQVALDNHKLSGVRAINEKFGISRISHATEDQYAEIHELLTKLTHGTS